MIKKFKILTPFSDKLIHGVTIKTLGSFNDQEKDFRKQVKKLPTINKPAFSNQLHGDKIIIVNKLPSEPFKGDAFITNKKEIPLAIKVADCQGILMFDPKTKTIAAVHSGWRGSALNIAGKTVQKMEEIYKCNPADLLVGISPSLGPCCSKFSEPKNELPESVHPFIKDDYVDFWSLTLYQLTNAGVPAKQIELMEECTKCQTGKYFSHRNKDTGRMAVFIAIK